MAYYLKITNHNGHVLKDAPPIESYGEAKIWMRYYLNKNDKHGLRAEVVSEPITECTCARCKRKEGR